MSRYKLTIEYDGTDFFGWQIQPDARTVEGDLEKAIQQVLQKDTDLVGQGRTDAGVHARSQVAHIDLENAIDPEKFILSLNRLSNTDVHVKHIELVDDDFHARFDAASRMYEYTLLKHPSPLHERYGVPVNRNCDVERMKEAAAVFIGDHDFAVLSKRNEEQLNTHCLVSVSEFEERDGVLIYRIKANRFLRNMVRRIIGSLLMIGEGKITKKDLENLLDNQGDLPVKTAPAKGLCLVEVVY